MNIYFTDIVNNFISFNPERTIIELKDYSKAKNAVIDYKILIKGYYNVSEYGISEETYEILTNKLKDIK